MVDWQAIKTEYITTATSYRKLAKKYGVSYVQIGNVGKEEKWVELRKQHLDETLTKTLDAVSDSQADRAAKLQTVTDKVLTQIEAVVEAGGLRDMPAKSIRAITAALKDIKEIQGIKSSLDTQEQEARIANLRKAAEKDEETVNALEIIFEAGEEAWNE